MNVYYISKYKKVCGKEGKGGCWSHIIVVGGGRGNVWWAWEGVDCQRGITAQNIGIELWFSRLNIVKERVESFGKRCVWKMGGVGAVQYWEWVERYDIADVEGSGLYNFTKGGVGVSYRESYVFSDSWKISILTQIAWEKKFVVMVVGERNDVWMTGVGNRNCGVRNLDGRSLVALVLFGDVPK